MKKTFKYLKCHPKYKSIKSCIDDKLILKNETYMEQAPPG